LKRIVILSLLKMRIRERKKQEVNRTLSSGDKILTSFSDDLARESEEGVDQW